METVKTTVLNSGVWQGSIRTAVLVSHEIAKRWGEEAAKVYDPRVNCFTLKTWNKKGFRVKKGEHGIKSITFLKVAKTLIEGEGQQTEEGKKTFESHPKAIYLFWKEQVEPTKGVKPAEELKAQMPQLIWLKDGREENQ